MPGAFHPEFCSRDLGHDHSRLPCRSVPSHIGNLTQVSSHDGTDSKSSHHEKGQVEESQHVLQRPLDRIRIRRGTSGTSPMYWNNWRLNRGQREFIRHWLHRKSHPLDCGRVYHHGIFPRRKLNRNGTSSPRPRTATASICSF